MVKQYLRKLSTLLLALCFSVNYCFAQSSQLGIRELSELNIIELNGHLDSLYIELSESQCSVGLIERLQLLIWMYHRREELSPPQLRGHDQLTFIQLYSKLGYLYTLTGEESLSESFYSIAAQIGYEHDREFYTSDYVRNLHFSSKMGCIAEEYMSNQ